MSNEGKKRLHNLIAVDGSGSMEAIREQALVGMNDTIETIKKMEKEREGVSAPSGTFLNKAPRRGLKIYWVTDGAAGDLYAKHRAYGGCDVSDAYLTL